MNLLNLLMGTLASDSSINSLSKKTGINASLITKLLPLAIPILLKELTKNAGREGGAASLLTALGQHTNTRSIPQQIDDVDEEDGQKIVAHILGDDSDKVVSALAQETGMEGSQVSRSLGALAPALMSMLSSSANTVHSSGVNLSDGFDLTDVMGLFGGAKPQQQNYSMLGSLLGGGAPQQQSSPAVCSALFWAAALRSSNLPAVCSVLFWAAALRSSNLPVVCSDPFLAAVLRSSSNLPAACWVLFLAAVLRNSSSPAPWAVCSDPCSADSLPSPMTGQNCCPCS